MPEPELLDVTNCICANLRKASRAISQAYNDALRPSGLTNSQFTVLAALSRTGEVPLTRLADVLVVDRTTLNRNLKPLIRRGVVCDRAGEDQRVRTIALTSAGESVYRNALPLWQGVQERIATGLGGHAWPELVASLRSAVALIQQS